MIESLHGKLFEKSIEGIIVDTHGVGYGLKVPLSTYYELPGNGQNVTLYVYTHIKEDLIQLFGFKTREEKEIFQRFLKIRGVGPKLSLNILSYLPISDLSSALEGINFETLVAIPGVGKKMAERILFEVKGMIDTKPKEVKGPDTELTREAKSALVNLGFPSSQTDNLVREVWNEDKSVTLETLIKKSLKRLTNL
ncbi:MAG: Holliday junction ATP-dependent DNA helicase RuvA [Syntrophorhabdus sp. PtaU1.Bin002]|nr:MAG: Holliday junction ATP-dependent DNA helicase RuvA [Syntrophorhabdus sp. PtaU1.Bin002]